MATGLRPVAASIPATPSLHGLVATATLAQDPGGWEAHGIQTCPENCVTVDTWNPQCESWPGDEPPQVEDSPDNVDCYDVYPFVLRSSFECSSVGFSTQDYAGRARRQLEAGTSKALEYEFWTGMLMPDNPHLASESATTLESGNAHDPLTALVLLGAALSNCYHGGRGTIHAPAWVVDYWLAEAGGGQLIREDGSRLVTVGRGDLIVAGTGYPGTAPNGDAPGVGNAWVYATGPVQYRLGDTWVEPQTIAEATDRRHNRVEYHASRFAMANFDPCCHFATLVNAEGWSGS